MYLESRNFPNTHVPTTHSKNSKTVFALCIVCKQRKINRKQTSYTVCPCVQFTADGQYNIINKI